MRIGIDCRLWSESGVGRYIRNLVEQLQLIDRKNRYVLFVLAKDRNEILKHLACRQAGVQNDKFRTAIADIRWHTIEEQLRFPSILNKENLDLVHFPYFSVPVFYNKPFIVTIHDLILNHFPTGEASTLPFPLYYLKLIGYKFVISNAAKKAKKIITVSNATKKEIVDHLKVKPSKVVVTYEGVDQKIRNPKSEILNNFQNTKYKIQKDKYFLYVGNAYPHKNLLRLIEAFSRIRIYPNSYSEFTRIERKNSDIFGQNIRKDSDLKLVLVGKEDYFYKRLKEKVKKMDLQNSVLFSGEVSDEELLNLYRNAKALVIPSLMEGFGLPALEALSNKCLVLASDISALKEVCGYAALYFDPYDIKDIANKIEAVCSNDSNYYSEKIKEGFKRARDFSWEKMAKETLSVYQTQVAS